MGVSVSYQGSWLIAKLSGELDVASVPAVRIKLEQALVEGMTNGLILDLTDITFMDSSGLGFILGRYRKLSELGGKTIVTGIQGQVRRVFELSGLTKIIPQTQTLAEALNVAREEN